MSSPQQGHPSTEDNYFGITDGENVETSLQGQVTTPEDGTLPAISQGFQPSYGMTATQSG